MNLRMYLAVPGCLILGIFALGIGIGLMIDPATCDNRPMDRGDLCVHGSRGSEQLVPHGATMRTQVSRVDPEILAKVSGHTYDDQIGHNRWYGPASVTAGVLFIAGAVWLGSVQLRTFLDRWEQHGSLRAPKTAQASPGQESRDESIDDALERFLVEQRSRQRVQDQPVDRVVEERDLPRGSR